MIALGEGVRFVGRTAILKLRDMSNIPAAARDRYVEQARGYTPLNMSHSILYCTLHNYPIVVTIQSYVIFYVRWFNATPPLFLKVQVNTT